MKIEQDVRPIPGCWLEQKLSLSEIQKSLELSQTTYIWWTWTGKNYEKVASWYLPLFCRDKRKRRQNTRHRNAEKGTTRPKYNIEEDESNGIRIKWPGWWLRIVSNIIEWLLDKEQSDNMSNQRSEVKELWLW